MAYRHPARVVSALLSGHLGHLGFYDLGEDLQADRQGGSEQALVHTSGEDLELAEWRVPEPEEFSRVRTVVPHTGSDLHVWAVDRFAKTYLDSWSTASLSLEWQYLHGNHPGVCTSDEMKSRKIDRSTLAATIADRVTDGRHGAENRLVIDKYTGVAKDLLVKGQHDAAVSIFNMACDLAPDSAYAHNNRGFCKLPDDPEGAISDFERARDMHYSPPVVPGANLVLALHRLGRNTSALQVADDAWEHTSGRDAPATMWDIHSEKPALVEVDAVSYLAELALHIASGSDHESMWKTRLGRRRDSSQSAS